MEGMRYEFVCRRVEPCSVDSYHCNMGKSKDLLDFDKSTDWVDKTGGWKYFRNCTSCLVGYFTICNRLISIKDGYKQIKHIAEGKLLASHGPLMAELTIEFIVLFEQIDVLLWLKLPMSLIMVKHGID